MFGEIGNNRFVAGFLLTLNIPVKEFWKLVIIQLIYDKNLTACFYFITEFVGFILGNEAEPETDDAPSDHRLRRRLIERCDHISDEAGVFRCFSRMIIYHCAYSFGNFCCIYYFYHFQLCVPCLWYCWFSGRKDIQLVKSLASSVCKSLVWRCLKCIRHISRSFPIDGEVDMSR